MPCKNLPKQSSSFQLSGRKAPTERIDIPKVYHRKLKDVLQSYEKLNPTLKGTGTLASFHNKKTFEVNVNLFHFFVQCKSRSIPVLHAYDG